MAPTLADLLPNAAELSHLHLGYEPGGGSLALRTAIAGLYDGLSPEHVLVTAGAGEAIRAAAMALVAPGDAVQVQEPSYAALSQAVIDAGGRPVPWRPGPGYALDAAAPSGLAFLNSPHGPTGLTVDGLERFPGRLVVDEVYRPIELVPGTRPPSCVDFSSTAVSIGDLSKPLGLGGLRIGWLATRDLAVRERCAGALDFLSGSVSALSAYAALRAIDRFDALLAPQLALARDNLSALAAFVEQHRDRIDWLPPQAGYTACLRLRTGPPPASLFDNLEHRGVFLLRGDVFGLPDCLRIGLGLPSRAFRDALALLGDELRALPAATEAEPDADVILFSRLPQPGRGKTRLAADLGVAATATLARAFFEDSARLAAGEAARLFVAIDAPDETASLPRALSDATVYPQRGAGLGERLAAAFERAFTLGAERPVLIGSDSPTLPGHLLRVAQAALSAYDVVLGPSTDGGYYAIGLREPRPSLFEGIDWSTERVLGQTIDHARDAGLRIFYLPYWHDVDTAADLPRLAETASPGSATSRALREIGALV